VPHGGGEAIAVARRSGGAPRRSTRGENHRIGLEATLPRLDDEARCAAFEPLHPRAGDERDSALFDHAPQKVEHLARPAGNRKHPPIRSRLGLEAVTPEQLQQIGIAEPVNGVAQKPLFALFEEPFFEQAFYVRVVREVAVPAARNRDLVAGLRVAFEQHDAEPLVGNAKLASGSPG